MILDIISFIILVGVIAALIVALLIQRKKRVSCLQAYAKAEVDKNLISMTLQSMIDQKESSNIEQTDGFLKFVSDSRDWAFSYIEDVQESLLVFDKKISKILDYYSTYGSAIDGLHTDLVKQISEAYEDLKSKLPKDSDKV